MINLPEIISMGIYNSKIEAKNIAVSKDRRTTVFELELAEEGGVSYIDSCSRAITPNLLICAKPGQVRYTQFPFRCYYVHFRVSDGALYEMLMELPSFISTERREVYATLFKKIIRCQNNGRAEDAVLLHSLLMELIYTLHCESSVTHRHHNMSGNTVIDTTLNYIKEHLTEDLRLETVAAVAHLSPIHFHNRFKAAMGKTLRDYVEDQRIKKAIDLLLTTDRSVTEIALACGFSSQSYFSSVFKRRLKKTPREYVQELNNRYEI